MPDKWLKLSFANFLIAAIYGCLMRYAFVAGVNGLEYHNIMHAHSHVAMLGWLYQALFSLIIALFITDQKIQSKYNNLFWATQISVAGMAISFPIQGYGIASISFSMIHVVLSYRFSYKLIRDLKLQKDSPSILFLRTALYLMILSTMALWLIAPVMSLKLQGSALYYGLVQFFLHFQFNGWYIFGAFALLFKLFENKNIVIAFERLKWFYYLLLISCFMTFTLAVTWSTPLLILFYINSFGVILQLLAMISFFAIVGPLNKFVKQCVGRSVYVLLNMAIGAIAFKILIQSVVVIPFIAEIAYTIRNFVIGFIHLLLLAGITTMVMALGIEMKWIDIKKGSLKCGLWVLLIGIFTTEAMLFLQGSMLWAGLGFAPFYYESIFIASVLMPVGILSIMFSFLPFESKTIRKL